MLLFHGNFIFFSIADSLRDALDAKKSNTSDDQIKELKNTLKSIDKMRSQVVELREQLSERYAESIADNVSNCTTQ